MYVKVGDADDDEARFMQGGSSGSGATAEDEGIEEAKVITKRTPIRPSSIAVEIHDAGGHMPYREWCEDCVAGRGVADPHRTKEDEERENKEICLDYCFPDGKKDGGPTVLVVRSRKCGTTPVLVMPTKGLTEEWMAMRVSKAIDNMGHGQVVLSIKTDGEGPIMAVRDAIMKQRWESHKVGSLIEKSARGDHASNGDIEKAVQEVEGMIRTLLHFIERKCGRKLSTKCPARIWLMEHTGQIISRMKMGKDGKVPYERVRGKKPSAMIIPILERILYKPSTTKAAEKARVKTDYRFEFGIYLGIVPNSNESWIGTPNGVITARSVRRVSEAEKWKIEDIEAVIGVPWDLKGERQGEAKLEVEVPERADPAMIPPPLEMGHAPEAKVKRMMITKKMVIDYGPTTGCGGCVAAVSDKRDNHNEACRKRMEEEMMKSPEGREQLRKNNERMAEIFIKRLEKEAKTTKEKPKRSDTEGGEDEGEAKRARATKKESDTHSPAIVSQGDSKEVEMEEVHDRDHEGEPEAKRMKGGNLTIGGGDGDDKVEDEPKRRRLDQVIEEKVASPSVGIISGAKLFDFTRPKKDSTHWDLSKKTDRTKSIKAVVEIKPVMIICGSLEKKQISCRVRHARACHDMIAEQSRGGRYFVMAVDIGSGESELKCVQKMKRMPGARSVVAGKVEIISNCREVIKHVVRPNNPQDVCRAVKVGLEKQLKRDQMEIRMIASMMIEGMSIPDHLCRKWDRYQNEHEEEAMKVEDAMLAAMDERWNENESFPDHVNGGYLDPVKVRKARDEEMEFVHKYKIYEKVSLKSSKGKKIIRVRWVDTNKGAGKEEDNYRSRLVAMEINRSPNSEYFSATPPLEVMKLIMSWVASRGEFGKGEVGLMYVDVRRAYFNAAVKREVYIQIPKEDFEEGDENKCARLKASLYGTRDAAANWADEYTKTLLEMGFVKGKASPCIFMHVVKGIKAMVHGDDFFAGGRVNELEWMREELKKR